MDAFEVGNRFELEDNLAFYKDIKTMFTDDMLSIENRKQLLALKV